MCLSHTGSAPNFAGQYKVKVAMMYLKINVENLLLKSSETMVV